MTRHPLIQKEWKNTRWIMLIFVFIYAVFALILNQNMQRYKKSYLMHEGVSSIFIGEVYMTSKIMLPFILVGIIALVVLLFHDDRNINVGRFIGSLPFSRKKQFTIKYIMGLVSFSLPLLIYGLAIWGIRISHIKWMNYLYKYQPNQDILFREESTTNLLIWVLLVWLIMLSLYSFLMFIQTLMGQNIVAGVIGSIIYLVPWFLYFAIPANIELISEGYSIFRATSLRNFISIFLLGSPIRGPQYYREIAIPFDNRYDYDYFGYDYRYLLVGIIVMMIVSIISTLLAYYFNQWSDVEKIGDIVMYPWFQKVLVAGVTICSALLLPIIITVFTRIENSLVGLISMIIGGSIGYIIITKSNELTKKHG